jgi:hypothetical protein
MICYCGKTALYRVHTQGFCKEHHADALVGARAIVRAEDQRRTAKQLRWGIKVAAARRRTQ